MPLRILLTDRIPLVHEGARAILEGFGHEVDIAADGREAAALAASRQYDVIVLDEGMPDEDALSTIRLIRSAEQTSRRALIVATAADPRPEHLAILREAGADAQLAKPFKPHDLKAVLSRYAVPEPAKRQSAEDRLDPTANLALRDAVDARAFERLLDQFAAKLESAGWTETQDLAALAWRAHGLVSAAGMLGFTRLTRLCRELERASTAGDAVAVQSLTGELAEESRLAATDARAWVGPGA